MIRNVKRAKNVAQIHTQHEMSPCSVTAKKGENHHLLLVKLFTLNWPRIQLLVRPYIFLNHKWVFGLCFRQGLGSSYLPPGETAGHGEQLQPDSLYSSRGLYADELPSSARPRPVGGTTGTQGSSIASHKCNINTTIFYVQAVALSPQTKLTVSIHCCISFSTFLQIFF